MHNSKTIGIYYRGGGTGLADPAAARPIISAHYTEMAECQVETAIVGPIISDHYNTLNKVRDRVYVLWLVTQLQRKLPARTQGNGCSNE